MSASGFEEVLRHAFRQQTGNLYTALPCMIINIHSNLESLMVDVQPVVNELRKDGVNEEHPPILGVPVVFPASSTTMISFPLHVGDTVLCVFAHRGLDNFKSGNGMPSAPTDYRRFDKRDAVAIPGLFPFAKSLNRPAVRKWAHNTNDLTISHNIASGTEVEIRLKANGDISISTDQNITVQAENVTVNATNTTWVGDITHTGTLSSNGVVLSDHVHTGVQAGGSNTGGPI